jgi:uncharacterized protein (TIGR00369 family)
VERPSWGKLRGNRYRLLGYRVTEMGEGRSRVDWTPGEDLSNPLGFVHGGFVAAMIDDTCGTAVASMLSDWRPFPTASLRVEFLKGLRIGESFVCRGHVLRAGRSMTFADTMIRNREGMLLARGTCTFALDLSDTDLVGFSALALEPEEETEDGVQQG